MQGKPEPDTTKTRLLNAYREKHCGKKGAKLYKLRNGENTLWCSSFIGSGTVLHGKKPYTYGPEENKPINATDRVAMTHDWDYHFAFKNEPHVRSKMIRKADLEMLNKLSKFKKKDKDRYYDVAKAGINAKILLENTSTFLAKKVLGEQWVGSS